MSNKEKTIRWNSKLGSARSVEIRDIDYSNPDICEVILEARRRGYETGHISQITGMGNHDRGCIELKGKPYARIVSGNDEGRKVYAIELIRY